MKVDSLVLREQFNSSDTLQRLLLQYANVLQTQAVQATVCRVLHNLNQRLARWLLVTSDCLEADVFKVTHEQIATALGKHRNRVGVAASRLQREGLIECERGRIKIVEREGLKAVACECYRIVQACMDSVG
jgi:CRP-like cAMP-binding protein